MMKKTYFPSGLLVALSMALWVGACSMRAPRVMDAPAPPRDAAPRQLDLPALAVGAARVVVGRMPSDPAGLLNVFRGPRFHTGLLPGEFTVLDVCPSNTEFAVASQASPRPTVGATVSRVKEQRDTLAAGEERFYVVGLGEDQSVSLQPVAHEVLARQGLSNAQRRSVLRSYVLDCVAIRPQELSVAQTWPVLRSESVVEPVAAAGLEQPAPAPAPATVATQAVSLGTPLRVTLSDAPWLAFAQYELAPAQRSDIRLRLERALSQAGFVAGSATLRSIEVRGHADAVGQPHRKVLVSGQRAAAVAKVLTQDMGFSPALVKTSAVADKESLVKDCPSQPRDQRDACNAPNRRVEVVFEWGAQR